MHTLHTQSLSWTNAIEAAVFCVLGMADYAHTGLYAAPVVVER